MQEGIILLEKQDNQIAEFIINQAYPNDVYPIACILSGSRGYGLEIEDSDRDYIGVHLMDTWECLEHPRYRLSPQVIRQRYNNKLEELPAGEFGSEISLDSFEMWKFLELMLKGAPAIYEILHMPPIHLDPGCSELLELCRSGLTNRIGKAVKGMAYHDWRKKKKDRKKTVTTYYRLIQTIFFLREQEFEWNSDSLIEYARPAGVIDHGIELISSYKQSEIRKTQLIDKEVQLAEEEIDKLIEEVDRAMMVTRFPDQYPREIFREILVKTKQLRSTLI